MDQSLFTVDSSLTCPICISKKYTGKCIHWANLTDLLKARAFDGISDGNKKINCQKCCNCNGSVQLKQHQASGKCNAKKT